MNEHLHIYQLKTGSKTRLITTYKNNSIGLKVRNRHEDLLSNLSTDIFNKDVAHAYIPGQQIKNLVKKHLDSSYFLTCDIKSFFNQINHVTLMEIVKQYQLEHLITFELLEELTCSKEKIGLGIGLLLSPYLSNLYLINFDQNVREYCIKHQIIYTRYADDLSFSSNLKFDQAKLLETVTKELNKLQLQVNKQKTICTDILNQYSSIKILGLNIVHGKNNNYITVSRKYKNLANNERNYMRKVGMENYISFNDNVL